MTARKLRICIVAPSLQLGGLENSVALMTNVLADKGHVVALVLCYRTERFYAVLPSVTILEPEFERKDGSMAGFYLRWMGFVRKSVEHVAPDVVLSYGDFHNALVLAGLAFSSPPVVISDRASPSLQFPYTVRLARALAYRRASGVVAQTRRAAEVKRALIGRGVPVRIIPNAVRQFTVSDLCERRPLILAAARHYRVKGLDRLVEAFARCRIPGWTLEIAGSEGPETPALKRQIEKLGLGERIRLLGSVKDMGAFYSRGEIFVLPSRSEGFPNALIEAMVCGCAPISFDIDAGPSDIIQHGGNGLLVKDADIEGLAAAITQLVNDQALRQKIGRNAGDLSKKLSLEHVGSQMEAFLLEVAG